MPLVTLTSDIGFQDYLVGAAKGRLLQINPAFTLADITHLLPPFNYTQSAYICRNAIKNFPSHTFHIILVNLFEHKTENLLLAFYEDQYILCADNGLLTMILQDVWGRRAVRLIVFFPSLVPAVVVSILWGYLFNPDGVINKILGWAGVHHPPLWLSPDNVLNTILLGMVWLSAGTYTVIFMAAADRIPKELYEVAELAGANIWQRFTQVTLPLMWDVVSVCAILWCVAALKTFEFLLVFAASSGTLPPVEIWNFAMYSYAEAFDPGGAPEYGAAAASAVIVLLLTAILTILARRVMRRDRTTF